MSHSKPEHPDGCKKAIVFKQGKGQDSFMEALDPNKVLFGVIKTGLDGAGSFSRKATVFVCYKGENLGQVKAAKIMARNLPMQAFVGSYAKVTASVNCYSKENVKNKINEAIKSSTIDDSKDMGNIQFQLGDTKADKAETVCLCKKFEVDLASSVFGICKCGFPRSQHSAEAIAAGSQEVTRRTSVESSNAVDAAETTGGGYAEEPKTPIEHAHSKHFTLAVMTTVRMMKLHHNDTAQTEYTKMCSRGRVLSGPEVFEIVKEEHGRPYNWALFRPSKDTLEVEDAGSGGIMELSHVLGDKASDKLLYALVRLAFGTGKTRRSWHFAIHWHGSNCKGIKVMTQKAECDGPMTEMLGGIVSFTMDCREAEDASPEEVIKKLVSSVVVDTDEKFLNVHGLVEALEEEEEEVKKWEAAEAKKRAEAAAAAAEKVQHDKEEKERLQAEAEAAAKEHAEQEEKARLQQIADEQAAQAAASQSAGVGHDIEAVASSNDDSWVLIEIIV